MKPTKMFRQVGLLLAAAIFSSATGAAAATVTLTYANFPPAATFPCVQMERWAKEVEKKTAGQVKVRTFPGGTLLNAKNMLEGVTSGVADIGNFAMSYQPGRFPVSEAIDLPYGFTSAKTASLVLYDLIDKYKPKEFEKVKIITVFTCPPTNFMTSKPVRTLADLKGMELRVAGTGTEIAKRLGAVPIAMPQSETPEAIQKGIVKGMVSSLEILLDLKFASYTPYATIANLPVVSFAVVMNKGKWDALPANVKQAIDSLSREQAAWTGSYADTHVQEALAAAKKNYNHQVFTLPPADQKKVAQLLQPMVDDYVRKVSAQGVNGKQIVADVLALKKKYEAPAGKPGKKK
ncbi:TRAP transporter substrate-binding protein [Geomonas sp. RF6]|uniref:TRAP transporter substrate-binding protein n=1 Tax=Geomonas sp. RF6 TaxID=2897342 RepID=UPI001E4C3E04|nr:TRAP transporter substrate-binding protein [Geomonas sp. RF6]UFS70857.1 TRAP transporter substrate-binding protein [Geomonas sp. RF6]